MQSTPWSSRRARLVCLLWALLILPASVTTTAAGEANRVLAPPTFDTELLAPSPSADEPVTVAEGPPAEKMQTDEAALSMILVSEPLDPDACTSAPTQERIGLQEQIRQTEQQTAARLGSGFSIQRCGPLLLASDIVESVQKKRILRTLRACCRALQADYFQTPPDRPVVVYAFRDRGSYRYNLRRLWNEMPISPYGHYNYARAHVVCNAATGTGTVVHETVHALMDADMPQAPVWLAEGLATLYEQCGFEKGEIRGRLNWRLPELKRHIRKESAPPLATLLRMDDTTFNRTNQSLNYAMARYLCYYLEQQGLMRRLYQQYRNRFVEDPTGQRFLEEVTGTPLASLDARWRGWVLALPSWRHRTVASR